MGQLGLVLGFRRHPVAILLRINRRVQRRRSVQRERREQRVADLRRQLRRLVEQLGLVLIFRRHPFAILLGVDYGEERWRSLQCDRWDERVPDLRRQLCRIVGQLGLVLCDLRRWHATTILLGIDYGEERWRGLQRERWDERVPDVQHRSLSH